MLHCLQSNYEVLSFDCKNYAFAGEYSRKSLITIEVNL
jgi:hypothetical protein